MILIIKEDGSIEKTAWLNRNDLTRGFASNPEWEGTKYIEIDKNKLETQLGNVLGEIFELARVEPSFETKVVNF